MSRGSWNNCCPSADPRPSARLLEEASLSSRQPHVFPQPGTSPPPPCTEASPGRRVCLSSSSSMAGRTSHQQGRTRQPSPCPLSSAPHDSPARSLLLVLWLWPLGKSVSPSARVLSSSGSGHRLCTDDLRGHLLSVTRRGHNPAASVMLALTVHSLR